MADNYGHILNTAKNLENQIKNLLDDKTHPVGRSMLEQSRQLVSDISQQKKPRQLEERVKVLIDLMHHSKEHGETIMDIRHSEGLHHGYEHLQMELRKFPNY